MGHRAYDIWSDMGIGIPYKVYLGSALNVYLMSSFLYQNKDSSTKLKKRKIEGISILNA